MRNPNSSFALPVLFFSWHGCRGWPLRLLKGARYGSIACSGRAKHYLSIECRAGTKTPDLVGLNNYIE
jgi:hypothetical protein